MGNDQSRKDVSEAEAQSEAERLAEFCSIWTERSDDPSDVRSAILAYLSLQQAGIDESEK